MRKGRLVTPPVTADILESITRTTLIDTICPELFGMGVVERDIARTELYVADEAFFCGSGYEITPILSIDRFPLGDGKVGPITSRSQRAYMDIVRGVDKRYPGVAHASLRQGARVGARVGANLSPAHVVVSGRGVGVLARVSGSLVC